MKRLLQSLRLMNDDTHPRWRSLVDDLVRRRLIQSAPVEAAFRAVPRHTFLPDTRLEDVYRDDVVVTRYDAQQHAISSSSQPAIMASMLEMLALQPGQRVLEIGAGTGYNAALIAHIVGESGSVTTVDLDEEIVSDARQHLAAVGCPQVNVICGDGAEGYAPAAPYDRIILSVGAEDIAPAWQQQLATNGRLVLPLTLRCAPRVFAFTPHGKGLRSVAITPGGFMPLRGADAPVGHFHALPESDGISLWSDHTFDGIALSQALRQPTRDFPTGVTLDQLSHWSGWSMWLELHEPSFVLAYFQPDKNAYQQTSGLAEGSQIAFVVPAAGAAAEPRRPFAVAVRCYGESDVLAHRLVHRLREWQAAGRPPLEDDMRVEVRPIADAVVPKPPALHLRKRYMQYAIHLPTVYV
jgi:protein-L-isoaspartate(D-aspartate) O-methyltransferase